MPKFTYGEGQYLFEHEFSGTLLPDGAYNELVKSCQTLIKEERDKNKLERRELTGKRPAWTPTPKELAQLRDDLAMTINKDLEQTIKNILKKK